MAAPVDESLPDELEEVCTNFHQRLMTAQEKLKPLASTAREDLHEGLGENLVDRAMMDLTVAYAANSLYWCYLCSQGVSTVEHPVKHELDRLKKAMTRAKDVQLKLRGRATTVNKEAAKRVLAGGLKTPGKQQDAEDSRLHKQRDAQDRAMAKRRSRSRSPTTLREASEKRKRT